MADEKPKKANPGGFKEGDARINRKGKPPKIKIKDGNLKAFLREAYLTNVNLIPNMLKQLSERDPLRFLEALKKYHELFPDLVKEIQTEIKGTTTVKHKLKFTDENPKPMNDGQSSEHNTNA